MYSVNKTSGGSSFTARMIDTLERLNVRTRRPILEEMPDSAFHGPRCRPYQVPTSGFKLVPCRIGKGRERGKTRGDSSLHEYSIAFQVDFATTTVLLVAGTFSTTGVVDNHLRKNTFGLRVGRTISRNDRKHRTPGETCW